MGLFYFGVFADFDDSIAFLKKSALTEYMPFAANYDPLVIKPVKAIKNMYEEGLVEYH